MMNFRYFLLFFLSSTLIQVQAMITPHPEPTELQTNCFQGYLAKIKECLKNGQDPNEKGALGRTPLNVLKSYIYNKKINGEPIDDTCYGLLQELIKYGAEPNDEDLKLLDEYYPKQTILLLSEHERAKIFSIFSFTHLGFQKVIARWLSLSSVFYKAEQTYDQNEEDDSIGAALHEPYKNALEKFKSAPSGTVFSDWPKELEKPHKSFPVFSTNIISEICKWLCSHTVTKKVSSKR